MGGAYVGLANDWTAMYWNPAGLAQLSGIGVGMDFASPHVRMKDGNSLSNLTPANMETRHQIDTFAQFMGNEPTRFTKETVEYDFYMPFGAGGYWQCAGMTMATGFYVPAGYYTDWHDSMRYGAGTINASLFQKLSIVAATFGLAKQVHPRLSIGAGLNLLRGEINYEAYKRVRNSGILDYHFNMDSDAEGYGVEGVFGLQAKVTDTLTLGGVYRTGASIDMKGDAGAFATLLGTPERSTFHQRFRHPATWGVGIAWEARPDLTVAVDWQRTEWSTFGVDINYKTERFILTDRDYSADWRDSSRYRFGVEWRVNPKLALRTGYFWDESPLRGKSVSLSNVPDVDRHNVTAGLGYQCSKHWQIDAVYHYGWGSRSANGETYSQAVNTVGVSLSYKF